MKRGLSHQISLVMLLLWGCFFWSLGGWIGGAKAEPLVWTGEEPVYSVNEALEVLEDPGKQLKLEEVLAPPLAASFRPLKATEASLGFSSSVYWLRFRVQNTLKTAQTFYLEVAYPHLDNLTLYFTQEKHWIAKQSGDHFPFKQREFPHRHFVFTLSQAAFTQETYYLRIESSSALTLPLKLWSPRAFVLQSRDEYMWLGLYYGVMGVMLLYNLFFYLLRRDGGYRDYVVFLFAYLLLQLSLNGLAFEYLWPESVWWANHALPVFLCLSVVLGQQFTRSFLDTSRHTPTLDQVILGMMAIGAIWLPCTLWISYRFSMPITSLIALGVMGVMLVCALWYGGQGFRPTRYYLWGWSLFGLGGVAHLLKVFAVLPPNFLTDWGLQIASAVQVVLLSLALFDRAQIKYQEQEKHFHETLESYKTSLAELQGQVEESNQELTAHSLEIASINQVMRTVNASLNLDEVVMTVIHALKNDFRFDQVHIHLWDEEQEAFVLIKSYGESLSSEKIAQLKAIRINARMSHGGFFEPIQNQKMVYYSKVREETLPMMSETERAFYEVAPPTAYLCYPLEVQNRAIGIVSFSNYRQHFALGKSHLTKIQQYVTQVATAINNAHLYEAVQRTQAQLEQRSQQLQHSLRETQAKEQEIRRINLQIARQNQIFRALLEASAGMQQTTELEELFSYTLRQLQVLFTNLSFGLILDGGRPEIVECAVFWKIEEEEQRKLLECHSLLMKSRHWPIISPRSVTQSLLSEEERVFNYWTVLPMQAQQRMIGKMVIRGPGLDKYSQEIIGLFLEQVSALADNRLLTRELERLANTDGLTGTYNRAYFNKKVEQSIQQAERFSNLSFAILLIDVNGLKRVNDVFGHHEGDTMIIKVAELLLEVCRRTDIVSRLGGDEFVVLCPATDYAKAQNLLERIREREAQTQMVCKHANGDEEIIPIRMSIGIATSEDNAPVDVMKAADQRMYADKQAYYATRQRYR